MVSYDEYQTIFNLVIKEHEGGYVNDPDDPGGETYMGVARAHWPSWGGWHIIDEYKLADGIDILDQDGRLQSYVKEFYYDHFWSVMKLDQVTFDLARVMFDLGVNAGIKRASKSFQMALNILNREQTLYRDIGVDGAIGPNTIGCYQSLPKSDIKYMIKLIKGMQLCHYIDITKKNKTFEKYIRGWMNRVEF